MKKLIIGAVVLLALGAIVFASLRGSRGDRGERVYAEAAARREITQVVKASGDVRARVSVDLSAHVVAKIDRLYVAEGDAVAAGQPFAELEKETFQAAVESAQAQLGQARTGVRQAEVDLADAEVRLARARRLAAEGIVAEEELDAAQLRRESAELGLDEARDRVANAQANLAKARDDLGKTTIYSPIAGRVVDLNAEEGEVVVSGMMNNPATKIATVADLGELLAELHVDENEIVHVELGQAVEVTVDAVRDRTFHGRVVEVGSSGYTRAGQGDVKFFRVKALLEDADPRLRPGMSLRAEIDVASHGDALVVPIQAVTEREGEEAPAPTAGNGAVQVVFVVEEGVARRREVEAGLSTVTEVEVLSGLTEGETVVTGPYRTLRDLEDGDRVRIVAEDEDEDEEDGGEGDD